MNPTKRRARAKQKRREARVHRNAIRRKRTLIVVGEGEDMPTTDEDLGVVEEARELTKTQKVRE